MDESRGGFARLPSRVEFDNHASEKATVIDVFAHDRNGLLYDISRVLFECGLSVMVAKIGTHLDQVVDVFYVVDHQTGGKILEQRRLAAIRRRLLDSIDRQLGGSDATVA